MTGTLAYILAKKIALGAVSGIKNMTFNGNQIIFHFNDGSSANMVVPIPKDGVSVVKVEINNNKHLICTMSDGTVLDAGEIPGGTGGGLIQVSKKSDLPNPGKDDTIYLVLNEETLYYWDTKDNKYKSISGSSGNVDFMSDTIQFDDINQTFDLPVDDKKVNVYLNGIYLTEDEDYTIDDTVTPNTITFNDIWETTDICTITWIKGNSSGGGGNIDNASFATKEDIDKLFENDPPIDVNSSTLATKADIDKLFS